MDIVEHVNKLMEKGETICLATVITSQNPDIAPGGKVLISEAGSMTGSLGDAKTDSKLTEQALAILKQKKSRAIDIEDSLRVFFDILSTVCGVRLE